MVGVVVQSGKYYVVEIGWTMIMDRHVTADKQLHSPGTDVQHGNGAVPLVLVLIILINIHNGVRKCSGQLFDAATEIIILCRMHIHTHNVNGNSDSLVN